MDEKRAKELLAEEGFTEQRFRELCYELGVRNAYNLPLVKLLEVARGLQDKLQELLDEF